MNKYERNEHTDTPKQDDAVSILVPMIKKVTPSLIANDLVGDQPMNVFDTVIKIGTKELEINGVQVEYYTAKVPFGMFTKNNLDFDVMYNWCVDNFGDGSLTKQWFSRGARSFLFKNEADRNWFLLRWG